MARLVHSPASFLFSQNTHERHGPKTVQSRITDPAEFTAFTEIGYRARKAARSGHIHHHVAPRADFALVFTRTIRPRKQRPWLQEGCWAMHYFFLAVTFLSVTVLVFLSLVALERVMG